LRKKSQEKTSKPHPYEWIYLKYGPDRSDPYEGVYTPLESEDEGSDVACDSLYSDDQHHDYDVNPSDFVIFLFDKGIDILTFTDKNYLHDMWVEFHGGDNPCGRDCCLYGSLCLQLHCDSNFM